MPAFRLIFENHLEGTNVHPNAWQDFTLIALHRDFRPFPGNSTLRVRFFLPRLRADQARRFLWKPSSCAIPFSARRPRIHRHKPCLRRRRLWLLPLSSNRRKQPGTASVLRQRKVLFDKRSTMEAVCRRRCWRLQSEPALNLLWRQFGAGLLRPLGPHWGLQAAYGFHLVNTPGAAAKFSTLEGGIRFFF